MKTISLNIDTKTLAIVVLISMLIAVTPVLAGGFFQQTPTVTGGAAAGAAGGGGAGVTITESQVAGTLSAGESTTITYSSSDRHTISQITITAKNDVTNCLISVFKHSVKPALVAEYPRPVYAYLQISPVNCEAEDFSSAEIRFLISNDWMAENNVAVNQIVMLRDIGGAWAGEYAATRVSATDTDVTYRVSVPGLSYFASAKAVSAAEAAAAEAGEAAAVGEGAEDAAADVELPELSPTLILGILTVILILVLIFGAAYKKNLI